MKYYSIANSSHQVTAREALLHGLAPDGSLFMPAFIPSLTGDFLDSLGELSLAEIGTEILSPYLDGEIERNEMYKLCQEAFSIPLPLIEVSPGTFSLELYHGPTYAFKDFAARFMARLMAQFVAHAERELVILVATSGDTGSAVAHGFFNVPGIRVVILYPSGKVSALQEKQLTSLGGNISAFEVEGVFDDCQALVKQAFVDPELSKTFWFSSANSINIFRLLPQMVYYFAAVGLLRAKLGQQVEPVICVPSGNFGSLSAGLFAKKMGLKISKFIAATNANDVVPQYFETTRYEPRDSIPTLSNAMDVGNPSNFSRMLELYEYDHGRMADDVWAAAFDDDQTLMAIRNVHQHYHYTLDPHGAVGWLAFGSFRERHHYNGPGIILETAHPAKFKETVSKAIGHPPKLPKGLLACEQAQKSSHLISKRYQDFRNCLRSHLT